MKKQMQFKSLVLLGSICVVSSLAVTGCSWLDPHKTLWETAQDASHDIGVGSRSEEYKQSENQSTLIMPEGIRLTNSSQLYPIPIVKSKPTKLSNSQLPPGSLAARAYIDQTEPDKLESARLEHVNVTSTGDNTGSLQMKNDFPLVWDATGLAIELSPYQLVKADYDLGIYFIADRDHLANKKTPLYQVILQGGTGVTTISLVDEKGQAVSTGLASTVLGNLQQQLLTLNNKRSPSTRVVSLVSSDIYGHPDLLVNRTVVGGRSAMLSAMKKANLIVVKSDPESSAYFFVDARNTQGSVKANMPIYLLYYRDKGVYSRYYVLNSQAALINKKKATNFLVAIHKQL